MTPTQLNHSLAKRVARRLGLHAWGGLHGLLLVTEHATGYRRYAAQAAQSISGRAILSFFVFQVITFSWILFRGNDLSVISNIFVRMFTFEPQNNISLGMISVGLLVLATCLQQVFATKKRPEITAMRLSPFVRGVAYGIGMTLIFIFASEKPAPFIYFQF